VKPGKLWWKRPNCLQGLKVRAVDAFVYRFEEGRIDFSLFQRFRPDLLVNCQFCQVLDMSFERNLAISLLKLTKKGPVLTELVKREAHLTSAITMKLLVKLQNECVVYLKQGSVEVERSGRIKLAVQAVSLGADIEGISNLLCWQEFEEIAGFTLKNNGYVVSNNVRFKQSGRRWEIDVVGCKKPLVVCIDCKHWQHSISPSALKRIVDLQVERTRALADTLPKPSLKLECTHWSSAKFMPAILSLIPCAYKFYCEVPVVPILQLQDFLNQFSAGTENLLFFNKTFNKLSHNLQN
jgi:Holliday junction resolvase-like predicted endonuclease